MINLMKFFQFTFPTFFSEEFEILKIKNCYWFNCFNLLVNVVVIIIMSFYGQNIFIKAQAWYCTVAISLYINIYKYTDILSLGL